MGVCPETWRVAGIDGDAAPFRKGVMVSPCDVLEFGFVLRMKDDSMGKLIYCERAAGGASMVLRVPLPKRKRRRRR